jgi:hypothetical protein
MLSQALLHWVAATDLVYILFTEYFSLRILNSEFHIGEKSFVLIFAHT